MKFRSLVAATAALTLATAPVLAQSAAADLGRTIAPVSDQSATEGDSDATLLAILALLALGLGVGMAGGNNSDKPASP